MTNTANTTCESCQTDAKRAAGEAITGEERTRWMMWGCTCTPEASAAANAFIASVTR